MSRVSVRVPFFGFGSGSGIKKVGFFPQVSGFQVPDYITKLGGDYVTVVGQEDCLVMNVYTPKHPFEKFL